MKYGAQSVIVSFRSKSPGYDWPEGITEHPLLLKMEGKKCFFVDGQTSEVDAIILATGYLHWYPYLEENLRLKSGNVLYPPNLYKSIVWMGPNGDGQQCGDNKLLYVGKNDLYYSFTLIDIEAYWAVKYLLGDIKLPEREVMVKDWKMWHERDQSSKTGYDHIKFQGDHIKDLRKDSGFPYDLDVDEMFNEWYSHRSAPNHGIATYREQSFTSKFTGTKAPRYKYTFMEAFDDSLESFLRDHA